MSVEYADMWKSALIFLEKIGESVLRFNELIGIEIPNTSSYVLNCSSFKIEKLIRSDVYKGQIMNYGRTHVFMLEDKLYSGATIKDPRMILKIFSNLRKIMESIDESEERLVVYYSDRVESFKKGLNTYLAEYRLSLAIEGKGRDDYEYKV